MTQDFITAITWIFHAGWTFFTGFYFPGTNVTPASMLLFGSITVLTFRFINRLLEFNPKASDSIGDSNDDE